MRICFLLLVFAVCQPFQVSIAGEKPFVIALQPEKKPLDRETDRLALEKWLSEKADLPAKVLVPQNFTTIHDGLSAGVIDVAFVSPAEMLELENEKSAEVLLAESVNGKAFYEGYWVAMKVKNYRGVKWLKDYPVTFSGRGSLAGFVFPMADLIKRGLLPSQGRSEDFFGEKKVFFADGDRAAVNRVFGGQAEAAAISEVSFADDKVIAPVDRQKLSVVGKVGPIPTRLLAVLKSMHRGDKDRLRKALLKLNQAPSLRDSLFGSKLIKVDPRAHLAPLKAAYEATGIVPN